MFNLPEIQVSSFISRSHLSWWSREAELLTGRLDKWLASYRGYTKLRTSRISRGCQTMLQESDVDATSSDECLKIPEVQKPRRSKRSYSQPSTPNRHNKTLISSQTAENIKSNKEKSPDNRRTNSVEANLSDGESKDPEASDVKVIEIEEEYKKQFRQPYGWTDYTKDGDMNKQNSNKNEPTVKKKDSIVEITRHNSNECCNCCYEFCLEEKIKSANYVAHDNKDKRKKVGPFQVITNKISQANSTCDKYFSFRRRLQVHTNQEDGFFAYRRRRSTHKKSSRIRHKRRIVFGGGAENDPMWPGVLLTFDRGVPTNHIMPLNSLPETVL